MNETTVLSITTVAGTLLGTLLGAWLGYWFQQASESRRRIRDACEQMIAFAYSSSAQLEATETAMTGGPSVPLMRLEDLKDLFLSRARIGLASPVIDAAESRLSLALLTALAAQTSNRAENRKAARDSFAQAVRTFRDAVGRELAHPWLPHLRRSPLGVGPVEERDAFDEAVRQIVAQSKATYPPESE